jgi:hypothetical protein
MMPLASRSRRWRSVIASGLALVAALSVAAGLAVPSAGAPTTGHGKATAAIVNHCHRSKIDVPSCGVLWGLYTPPVASKGHYGPHYGPFERAIGRRFDIVKDYVDWKPGDTFPNDAYSKLAAGGQRILYVSWNAINYRTHSTVSYKSIADGKWDKSVILPEAQRLEDYHAKIFIDFNHEFDAATQSGKGGPKEYVKAYRHIYEVLRHAGVKNVIWAWVSTGTIGNIPYIKASWPGAKYVDWIGYDPYNFASCIGHDWHTPYQAFEPFYHWLSTQPAMKHKPILLGEYGSAKGPRVKQWYASIAHTLERLPRIKALFQWSAPTIESCDVSLADSSAAMAGFKKSSNSPLVTGR